jgi:hypothetical protein
MKIDAKLNDGTQKTVDTNKLSDREAELLEVLQKLYEVCERYNIIGIARVVLDEKNYVGSTFVPQNISERLNEADCLFGGIDDFLEKHTGGRFCISKKLD